MSTFSNRLTEAIKMRGVTQAWVADKSNTTEATISRYSRQENAPVAIELLAGISSALNVSADYLIGRTNLPESKPTLAPDKKILLDCYAKISDCDAMVLWALLDKYMSPHDREVIRLATEKENVKAG